MEKKKLLKINDWYINLENVNAIKLNSLVKGSFVYIDTALGFGIPLSDSETTKLLKHFKIEELN